MFIFDHEIQVYDNQIQKPLKEREDEKLVFDGIVIFFAVCLKQIVFNRLRLLNELNILLNYYLLVYCNQCHCTNNMIFTDSCS